MGRPAKWQSTRKRVGFGPPMTTMMIKPRVCIIEEGVKQHRLTFRRPHTPKERLAIAHQSGRDFYKGQAVKDAAAAEKRSRTAVSRAADGAATLIFSKAPRNALHRRRRASAIRALPSAVLGTV